MKLRLKDTGKYPAKVSCIKISTEPYGAAITARFVSSFQANGEFAVITPVRPTLEDVMNDICDLVEEAE